ncbi:hypothetical protein K3W91_15405, partial [Listeria monocytogenes]|nr:hypothetical protein [Listeria monocytogenes]
MLQLKRRARCGDPGATDDVDLPCHRASPAAAQRQSPAKQRIAFARWMKRRAVPFAERVSTPKPDPRHLRVPIDAH